MDEFSYLSVLLSIIIGLAIAQLLQGLTAVIQWRDRVRVYWPAVLWAITLLAIAVQMWWAMFGMRQIQDWTFLQFSVVILQTVIFFVLTALVLPNFAGESQIDLRANYYSHSRWFFAGFAGVLIVSLLKDVVLSGSLPNRLNVAFHCVGIFTSTIAIITRSEIFHRCYAVFVAILFTAYIAALFARLH